MLNVQWSRAEWHGKKCLEWPVGKSRHPTYVHHLRCFVLLAALHRGDISEFHLLRNEPCLQMSRTSNNESQ